MAWPLVKHRATLFTDGHHLHPQSHSMALS